MERWSGILKVPLNPNSQGFYRIGASLCLSPVTNTLTVPSANAIFFNGDRVQRTGNPVIERLSDLQKIAEILVSKFGGSVNAWVIEASVFSGSFAVYKDFIPSVNEFGEPKSYCPIGFPASRSTVSLLTSCFEKVKYVISKKQKGPHPTSVSRLQLNQPRTIVLGFSKGGTILNQLVTELAHVDLPLVGELSNLEEDQFIPITGETLLNSITEIHYVDVGLNSSGAYLTDHEVIIRISNFIVQRSVGMRFVLHGTPRQWWDKRRVWICNEKDRLAGLLKSEAEKSGGKLQVCERFYFANRPPDLQMHFEIIEELDIR